MNKLLLAFLLSLSPCLGVCYGGTIFEVSRDSFTVGRSSWPVETDEYRWEFMYAVPENTAFYKFESSTENFILPNLKTAYHIAETYHLHKWKKVYYPLKWDGPTFDKCVRWEDEIVVVELTDNKGQKTGLQESKTIPACKESKSYQIGYRSDGIVAWREVKK